MKEQFKKGDPIEVHVRDIFPQLFPFDDFWFSGTFIAQRGACGH
jgi:hypothetical protein